MLHRAIGTVLTDAVPVVVAGVMGPLAQLRQLWVLKGEPELEREVVALFELAKETQSGGIAEAWQDAFESVDIGSATGSTSALPKLHPGDRGEDRRKVPQGYPLKAVSSLQAHARPPRRLFPMGTPGKPRIRTIHPTDASGAPMGSSSYSGPGIVGPRLTEPALSMIGGPLLTGPGMGGRRRGPTE
jgi:hypothetical protein